MAGRLLKCLITWSLFAASGPAPVHVHGSFWRAWRQGYSRTGVQAPAAGQIAFCDDDEARSRARHVCAREVKEKGFQVPGPRASVLLRTQQRERLVNQRKGGRWQRRTGAGKGLQGVPDSRVLSFPSRRRH